MNFITNNKELLLVHRGMDNVKLQEPINIMLTPQFYTVKKEFFPIKYAYQAKKVAPSLFEGLLDESGNYDYSVYRENTSDGKEEKWVFIAYDIEKILDFLEKKGISVENVSKVFFAEQSKEEFSKAPVILSDDDALTVIDDTVVVVPRIALSEELPPPLNFTNDFTPKSARSVKLKNKSTDSSGFLGETQAITLTSILLLLAGIYFIEGFRYNGDNQIQKKELESIYQKYPYLKSSYTREDALKKYKFINEHERKKRDIIKTFSNLIFKGVTLNKITLNDELVKSEIQCDNQNTANRVKSLLRKKNSVLKVTGNTALTIEGKL